MTTKQKYLTLLVKLWSTLMMQRSMKGQDVYIQTHLPLRFWHKMYAHMLFTIICWPGENYDLIFFWVGLFTVLILLGWWYFLLKATRDSNVSSMKWWRVCFEKWVYKQKTPPRTTCDQNVCQDYRNLGLVVPCTLFFEKGTTVCILHCVQVRFLKCAWWQTQFQKSTPFVMFSRCCHCCWLLHSAILRTGADSQCLHVILYEWLAFYGAFLNIHWSIHSTVWLLHVLPQRDSPVPLSLFDLGCWWFFVFVFIRFDTSVEQLI